METTEKSNNELMPKHEAYEHLRDLISSIQRWTTRGKHHAFVFLHDGTNYILFANRPTDLMITLPCAIVEDPDMAAFFEPVSLAIDDLTEAFMKDHPDWKEEYMKDGGESFTDDDYFHYGGTYELKDDDEGR